MKSILVTGCAGFIGSNFLPYFLKKYPNCNIVNLDLHLNCLCPCGAS